MQALKLTRIAAMLLVGSMVATTTVAGSTVLMTVTSATAEAKSGGGGKGGGGGGGGRSWNGGKNWNRSGGGGHNNYGYYNYYPRFNYFNYGYWGGFYNDWYAPRYYVPRYYYPRYAPNYGTRDTSCHARYRSYNSRTGTYTGYDGKQHRCGAVRSGYGYRPQSGSSHRKAPVHRSQCLEAKARSGEHSADAATYC